jgi:ParB family transcriptional regulator, chromosome partitioning protein
MADYWEANEDSYLGRVSKDLVLEAVTEACGKAEAAKLAAMKKGAAAKAAARLMKGKGWLPDILRGGK